ncbi:MAG: NUDIX hydrolase [Bosea sp. (in: a-proteobacteria)]
MSTSIIPIRTVTARRIDFDWPFRRERAGEIAAHWQALKAEKPAMFNGQVLLQCRGEVGGETFSADYFELDFASFIAWHRWGYPQQGSAQIRNGFAMGALRSRDGAYVMGVMANHTVNAGRIYFAAGTPDPGDVLADGTVDLAGSLMRELEEETGLLASEVNVGEGWRIILSDERVAFMRDLVIDLSAEEARALIRDRLSRQSEPELADIVLARSAADIDEARMPLFMQVFLRDVFKTR